MKRALTIGITIVYLLCWFNQTTTTVFAATATKPWVPGECVPTSRLFKEQNLVLASECCPTGTPSNNNATPVSSSTPPVSGEGGGCGNDADFDQANKDQIRNFLISKFREEYLKAGDSPDQAEINAANAAYGVMGNWAQESKFDSNKINEGLGCNDSPAYGIAQWCFGRIQKLKDFARQQGKLDENGEATCLGVQLEYMWSEMQGPYNHLIGDMRGKDPAQAASIFNLGGDSGKGGFEVGADNDKRMNFATQMQQEYEGKGTAPSTSTPGSKAAATSSSNSCTPAGQGNKQGGAIPSSAECEAMKKKIKDLSTSKKILYDKAIGTEEAPIGMGKDIANCTTGTIQRCGPDAGAHPNTLRGIAAAAEAPGVDSITLWNINGDHPCDEFDHPVGLATDIKQCNGADAVESNAACQALFDYLLENADKLNITYLIWDGAHCQKKRSTNSKVNCKGDHADHIHISFAP